jgi:pectinesterase
MTRILLPFLTLALTSTLAAQPLKTLTVAADGSGDFSTVQAAVDSVPDHNANPIVIHIRPGTYKERIRVPKNKPFITFRGDDAARTVLTWDWNAKTIGPEGREVGTSGSYSTRIDAPDFVAENITFENTAGDAGQALALFAKGDRQIYRNCRMLGWQDTLYADGGRQYYANCYIEGRVDFIFGSATAVFDRCRIHSKNGGYVTAASTPQEQAFGYVFIDCTLTGDPTPWRPPADHPAATQPARQPDARTYLGRPWRDHAAVAFIRCELGDHIRPEGWHNWGKPERERTSRYVEYANTGAGADRAGRVAWSRALTAAEAEAYTPANVLAGSDGWNPTAR